MGVNTAPDLRAKTPRWLPAGQLAALVLSALALGLYFAGLPAQFRTFRSFSDIHSAEFQEIARANLTELGLTPSFYGAYNVALSVTFAGVCLLVAGVIFTRRRREPMALFVVLLLALLGTTFATPASAWEAAPFWSRLGDFLTALGAGTVFLFFFLFPSGTFVPRWMRLPALAFVLFTAFASLLGPNNSLDPENWSRALYALFLFGWIAVGVAAQVYRYRRVSNPSERAQTRWVIFGFALALVGYTLIVAAQLLLPDLEPGTVAHLAGNTLAVAAMALIPLSIGVAILRHRLFDIDLVIRRTLIYSILTALLAGSFYLSIVVMQRLLAALTGETRSSLITTFSTLLIAALFTPLRRRVQSFIDRRFYRQKYDSRRILARFGGRVRSEVELEVLAGALLDVVEQTMQPEEISLWLRAPRGKRATPPASKPAVALRRAGYHSLPEEHLET
ncbi:MAG: hypothetical protein R3272_10300 [Candidatus Promineifilaceae bacterium]|nr:hypothetical protein [Candidatus Promineifilaceae bacterium]